MPEAATPEPAPAPPTDPVRPPPGPTAEDSVEPVRIDDPSRFLAALSLRVHLLGVQCSQEKIYFSGGTALKTWPDGFKTRAEAKSGPMIPLLRWQCRDLRKDLDALRVGAGVPATLREGIARVGRQLDYLSTRYVLEPERETRR